MRMFRCFLQTNPEKTRRNKREAERRDVFVPTVRVQTAAKPHSAQENLFSVKSFLDWPVNKTWQPAKQHTSLCKKTKQKHPDFQTCQSDTNCPSADGRPLTR